MRSSSLRQIRELLVSSWFLLKFIAARDFYYVKKTCLLPKSNAGKINTKPKVNVLPKSVGCGRKINRGGQWCSHCRTTRARGRGGNHQVQVVRNIISISRVILNGLLGRVERDGINLVAEASGRHGSKIRQQAIAIAVQSALGHFHVEYRTHRKAGCGHGGPCDARGQRTKCRDVAEVDCHSRSAGGTQCSAGRIGVKDQRDAVAIVERSVDGSGRSWTLGEERDAAQQKHYQGRARNRFVQALHMSYLLTSLSD